MNLKSVKLPELKMSNFALVSRSSFNIFEKYSCVTKLVKVTAWCLRFIRNMSINKNSKIQGSLSIPEVDEALRVLIKVAQKGDFEEEVKALRKGKELNKSSKILALDPFLDKNGILRVGRWSN
jgi:hypothetical protein